MTFVDPKYHSANTNVYMKIYQKRKLPMQLNPPNNAVFKMAIIIKIIIIKTFINESAY